MATERKADHYSSQLSFKNLLRSHFNTNSPLLSTLNVLQLLLVLVLCTTTFAAFSQSIVKSLPGYPGDLPFKLETGSAFYFYSMRLNSISIQHFIALFIHDQRRMVSLRFGYVSVGEWNDVHLFYYFIESEGNPREDPLILWLTGGPGCSRPLHCEKDYFDGKFPNLAYNPFSWTKVASIIFLDAPVGSGFSYADNAESYISDDLLYATDAYNFLLKGYILGNPVTSQHNDKNARIEYAHRLALLSDKLYKSIKHNCRGEYVTIDPNNAPCIMDLTLVNQCLANLDYEHILEPYCNYDSNNSSKLKWDRGFIQEEPTDFLLLPYYNYYVQSDIWANDERVRQALHIRKGTKDKWQRCNDSMAYTEVVFTSLDYHRNLSHTSLRALIYSGDHDMKVPYFGTHKWIESLGLTVDEEWRPWFVDGQNAGFVLNEIYKGKCRIPPEGAGHTAPAYKPKETFGMIERWLAFFNL
ncbi:hypothetical protein C3L33_21030, partial [Rhododendron williamsianum]